MAEISKPAAENSLCLDAVKLTLVIRVKIKSFNFIKQVDLLQNTFLCRMGKSIY